MVRYHANSVHQWDTSIIPKVWNEPAMIFKGLQPDKVDHVTEDDITSFFVNYMRNDCLGMIANCHLANADWLDLGANDERCKPAGSRVD